jgi:hypothetical protein
MMSSRRWAYASAVVLVLLPGCGKEANPTGPSSTPSFLAGTWRGTATIQVNPGDPNPPAPSTGPITWVFEVVPQTNQQTFRTTIRSTHPWLAMETTASTALTPGNSPPAQISTQGEYPSPRGCRGTFASVGVAEATRIEADLTGVDCQQATFSGRVVLTKD